MHPPLPFALAQPRRETLITPLPRNSRSARLLESGLHLHPARPDNCAEVCKHGQVEILLKALPLPLTLLPCMMRMAMSELA